MSLRDSIAAYVPSWLGDSFPAAISYGYRTLWAVGRFADLLIEVSLEGQLSAVGRGTPTALPYVGQARGIIRGQGESAAAYFLRLQSWIDRARHLGSQYAIAREVHEYLSDHPRVRVVNRQGVWFTIETDGTTSTTTAAWDWDSVTNPERAGFWSELWVIVYTSQFPPNPVVGSGHVGAPAGMGFGHQVPREDYDNVKQMVLAAKAAHSRIRAIIWTTDNTRFDPATPGSLPDGTWGEWSYMNTARQQVPSGRNISTCRYWEPT